MNNKDKLICLFESEGFDVKDFKNQKKDSLMSNKERTDFVAKEADLSDSLKKSGNYKELCDLEHAMSNAENDMYGGYPTNPFIYDYKSGFLRGQRICDSLCTYDGESISIEQLKNSKISNQTKDQVLRDLKRRWNLEAKNYIGSRKSKELIYVEKDLYGKKFPVKFEPSMFLVLVQVALCVILFLLAKTNVLEGITSFIGQNVVYAKYRPSIGGVADRLFWVFAINTIGELGIVLFSKIRSTERISAKYNELYADVDRVTAKISPKQMASNNLLSSYPNYVEKCDKIDRRYRGGKRSGVMQILNLFQITISITGLIFFIMGCCYIKFWILIIFMIALEIVRGITNESRC